MDNEDASRLSNQSLENGRESLAEDPRHCVLLIDPHTYDGSAPTVAYQRTERRGMIFEQLREHVETIAAYRRTWKTCLRFRVATSTASDEVDLVREHGPRRTSAPAEPGAAPSVADRLGSVAAPTSTRSSARRSTASPTPSATSTVPCSCCSTRTAAELYTMASKGIRRSGRRAPRSRVGEGIIGIRRRPRLEFRIGNLARMTKYARERRSYEQSGDIWTRP